MASELRVNTINSRTGFGTITVSETGQDLVGITTIENLTAENTLVGAAASFTGNVSVGGVLTYEDVTNIDSVGLITARQGIEIGARPGVAASISVDGNLIVSGISTLGGKLAVGTNGSTDGLLEVYNATSKINTLTVRTGAGAGGYTGLAFGSNTTHGREKAAIYFQETHGSAHFTGDLVFAVNATSGGAGQVATGDEKVRITSGGDVTIGNSSVAFPSGGGLQVYNASAPRIKLTNSTTGVASGDGLQIYVSGSAAYFDHKENAEMRFYTNATERLRITSAGKVGINEDAPIGDLHIITAGQDQDGILYVGGSAASLGLKFQYDQDANTVAKIYSNATYTNSSALLHIGVDGDNNPNQFVLKGNGYCGINNAAPTTLLDIRGTAGGGATGVKIVNSADEYTALIMDANRTTTGNALGIIDGRWNGNQNCAIYLSAGADTTNKDDGRLYFQTRPSGGSIANRLILMEDGQAYFNSDSASYGETYKFYNHRDDTGWFFWQNSSNDHSGIVCRHGRGLSGYNGRMFNFKRNDGTTVGSIDIGPSSTGYNTSSDYRLKENQVTIANATTKVKQLKPYEFNFKDDPDYKILGFFAHEVQEVIPNGAVTGIKDAVEKDGSIKAQSIDYGRLTPILTAALQEAIAKIEVLETEVAALKSS